MAGNGTDVPDRGERGRYGGVFLSGYSIGESSGRAWQEGQTRRLASGQGPVHVLFTPPVHSFNHYSPLCGDRREVGAVVLISLNQRPKISGLRTARMSDGILTGALVGAGLAVAYSAVAYLLGRAALRSSRQTFMVIVMGGMVARMLVALLILTLILVFVPIHTVAFLLGFFGVFMIGMTFEIVTLHRQQQAAVRQGDTAA